MKPSNFCNYPWGSVSKNYETENAAVNIMKILRRTGDIWRELSFEEYKTERLKDSPRLSYSEEMYFNKAVTWCTSPEKAFQFCKHWNKKE